MSSVNKLLIRNFEIFLKNSIVFIVFLVPSQALKCVAKGKKQHYVVEKQFKNQFFQISYLFWQTRKFRIIKTFYMYFLSILVERTLVSAKTYIYRWRQLTTTNQQILLKRHCYVTNFFSIFIWFLVLCTLNQSMLSIQSGVQNVEKVGHHHDFRFAGIFCVAGDQHLWSYSLLSLACLLQDHLVRIDKCFLMKKKRFLFLVRITKCFKCILWSAHQSMSFDCDLSYKKYWHIDIVLS